MAEAAVAVEATAVVAHPMVAEGGMALLEEEATEADTVVAEVAPATAHTRSRRDNEEHASERLRSEIQQIRYYMRRYGL